MSIELIVAGLAGCLFGGIAAYSGWKRRKMHQLITGTETTKIQQISDEGRVKIEGQIVGSGDEDDAFTSPISQTEQAVFTAWEVEEWNEGGNRSSWDTLASGVYSTPFVIDDGTDQIRVSIEDRVYEGNDWLSIDDSVATEGTTVDGVTCDFDSFPALEVDAESESPEHIRRFFEGESGLSEQSGSIRNLVNVGNAHGDRRYHEGILTAGDDVSILGHVRAEDDATTPLQPEEAVITPAKDEPFVVSDHQEDALTDQLGGYRSRLVGGALVIVLSIVVIGAGLPSLF